jgi:hypothetical protein
LLGAPAAGPNQDGLVYAFAGNGNLVVATQDTIALRWAALRPAHVTGLLQAAPTLDCNREKPGSTTGVLYFVTNTGWVTSYIVDSAGLDTTAPWAKYQRDARNTGNLNAPRGCP